MDLAEAAAASAAVRRSEKRILNFIFRKSFGALIRTRPGNG
jgi:hypothetical protein